MLDCKISLSLLTAMLSAGFLAAQASLPNPMSSSRNTLYGGYTLLSNSFNAHTIGNTTYGSTVLNGWDAAFTSGLGAGLAIKVAAFGYYGTSAGNPVHEHTALFGPQFSLRNGATRFFVHGLAGFAHINSAAMAWDGYHGPSSNLAFATMAGGGLDRRIVPHIAWRFQGDYLYTDFKTPSDQVHIAYNSFGRFATGPVLRF
jgi:hypothetical protein